MAFGIYKPGQGYWVRVLTATFVGVLVLAAALWVWAEMEKLADKLPKSAYVITVLPATGGAAPGQTVALLAEPAKAGDPPTQLGTATVSEVKATSTSQVLTVTSWTLKPNIDMSQVRRIGPENGSAATVAGPVSGAMQGRPMIEPLYLEGIGAGVFILAGTVLTFWLVGVSPRVVEFLIATDGEMKKVNWSSRKDIMGSTWVVIMWSVLIAGGLFFVDLAFSRFFYWIGVLQQ